MFPSNGAEALLLVEVTVTAGLAYPLVDNLVEALRVEERLTRRGLNDIIGE